MTCGSTYMWDMAPPNETDKKAPRVQANDTIRHVTFLRHPLLRLRAQVLAAPRAPLLSHATIYLDRSHALALLAARTSMCACVKV